MGAVASDSASAGRLRLRPTALGMKALMFYGLLLGTYFVTPYMNLFFLLLLFLTVAGAATAWWGVANMAGTRGEVLEIEPAAVGDEAVVVANASGGRRRRLLVGVMLRAAGREHRVAGWSTLQENGRARGALGPLPRGVHAVEAAWLESRYPFGLLRASRPVAAPSEVVVYPAPADLGGARGRAEVLSALCGPLSSSHGEPGPAGLREYRQGDEPRHVHWKATARRSRLVVREWESCSLAGLEVCLDLRCDEPALERALSVLSALALWAYDNKEVLLLRSQDHTGTYGENHRPLGELWAYLARATALPLDGPAPPVCSPGVLRLPSREPAAVAAEASR